MSNISSRTIENLLHIEVSTTLYDKEAVLNTCYKLSGKCFCSIDSKTDVLTIEIQPKDKRSNLNELELQFRNELIDQQVRKNTNKEFQTIREEIVKKAFSSIS
jgi:His-Xaa-Ser system protein HxsD